MQIALMPFVRARRFNSSLKSAPSRPFLASGSRAFYVRVSVQLLLRGRENAASIGDLRRPSGLNRDRSGRPVDFLGIERNVKRTDSSR